MNSKKIIASALIIGLVAGIILFLKSCSRAPKMKQTDHRVIVLGFDGMDPKLLAQFMESGSFPNFQKLLKANDLQAIRTSNPPQSPVAWSNFTTGTDPGEHAIFDFIHRDPSNYMPYLSTSRTLDPENTVKIGKWMLPLSRGRVELKRGGTAFWQLLEENGVPATIFRIPSNFPPIPYGRSISGMGTPDLPGGYGSFTFFTEVPIEDKDITGGEVIVIHSGNGHYTCRLTGPSNIFLKGKPPAKFKFDVWKDSKNESAKFRAGDSEFLLNKGMWSDWVRADFEMIPHLSSVSGIFMIYLKQVHPHLQFYVTPVNIDPTNPALPISYPPEYAKELAHKFGPFYTQGMPEDTKALDHGILSDLEYMQQTDIFHKSIEKIYKYELKRFKSGFLFFYFSDIDIVSHMFWSGMDASHPGYAERSEASRSAIFDTYKNMDRILGMAIDSLNEGDTLIVMSDHGFAPFYRSFHLNSWLKENGYLALIDESSQGKHDFFTNVDWSRTRAYGLGFNSLYLNLYGREGRGIVLPGPNADSLMKEIREQLQHVVDPETGKHVVSNLYFAKDIYTGKHVEQAPDMIVGYSRGYRASWETAVGKIPRALFSDNEQKWSGDHCIDFIQVPGVLLSNKKIRHSDPALYDLPVTILSEFGVKKAPGMKGRELFK